MKRQKTEVEEKFRQLLDQENETKPIKLDYKKKKRNKVTKK